MSGGALLSSPNIRISRNHNRHCPARLGKETLVDDARLDERSQLLEMTADIVSAYVGNNSVSANDLPSLISNIHAALSQVSTGVVEVEPEVKEPAVPIRKS